MPNMLSKLGNGQGGINANDVARLKAMQKEAELEAYYQQQREAERQALMGSLPQGTAQPQPESIRDYIARARGVMPNTQPMPRPQSSPFQNFLALFGRERGQDPRAAMAGRGGDMALNNQRIRLRMDDAARMQARQRMLDGY